MGVGGGGRKGNDGNLEFESENEAEGTVLILRVFRRHVSRHPARSTDGISTTRNLDYRKIPTIKPIYNLSFLCREGKSEFRRGEKEKGNAALAILLS